MHINLNPELEAQVKADVISGTYGNVSEVIEEALRLMYCRNNGIRRTPIKAKEKVINENIDTKFKDAFDNIFR